MWPKTYKMHEKVATLLSKEKKVATLLMISDFFKKWLNVAKNFQKCIEKWSLSIDGFKLSLGVAKDF